MSLLLHDNRVSTLPPSESSAVVLSIHEKTPSHTNFVKDGAKKEKKKQFEFIAVGLARKGNLIYARVKIGKKWSWRSTKASETPTDGLDAKHHTMWQKARDDHRTHAARVAAFQRESLKTSHAARLALLREQLAQAQEDRIRRMRQSQIDTAEFDYQRHLQDIELSIARADIISEEVASGVILIHD